MKSNTFCLSLNKGIQSGPFNIYQARNGGINLYLNHRHTQLSHSQIEDLRIPVHELRDFDEKSYKSFYENEQNLQVAIEIEGGNAQYVYSTSNLISVAVVDIDNMKATDPGEEYSPGIFPVEILSVHKMNKYLESATKIIE